MNDALCLTDASGIAAWFKIVGWDEGREILKAGDIPDGARWVTAHPAGPGTTGVPLLIQPVKGGGHRVIGGAGGKLNGLKMHKIKDPEQYAEEAKQKKHADRIAERERKAKLTPEERAAEKEHVASAKTAKRGAEEAYISKVYEKAGFKDDDPNLTHRQRLSRADAIARETQRKVQLDAEARAAAGISQVGGEGPISAEDFVAESDGRGPGYKREVAKRAEAMGQTAEALAAKVDETVGAKKAAGDKPQADHPVPVPSEDEIKANQDTHAETQKLKAHQEAALKAGIKASLAENHNYADILAAKSAFRKEIKKIQKGESTRTFEPGYQMVTEDEGVPEEIEDAIYQKLLTNHVQAFLSEAGETYPPGAEVDPTAIPPEGGLEAARGAGAFDCLHEMALASIGQGCIDRDVVEVLGPEGAAQIMARAIRHNFTPEDQEHVLAALEHHHLKEQETLLPEVTAEAKALRDEAATMGADLAETPQDLAIAVEMQKQKLAHLKEARRILSGTLGRIESRAAVIASLHGKPQDSMSVPLGKMPVKKAIQTAASLGLKDEDYTVDYEGGEAVLNLNGQGMDRLIQPVDEGQVAERELALAIKRGDLDEPDWLPSCFAKRPTSRYDNPVQEAPEFASQLEIESGANADSIKDSIIDHVGGRIADGERPSDILSDLFSEATIAKVSEAQQAEYLRQVNEAFPLDEIDRDQNGEPKWQTLPGGEKVLDVHGDPIPKTKLKTADSFQEQFQAMAEQALEKRGVSGDLALHAQHVDPDHPDFHEAIHQAIAADPRTAAAYVPIAELTNGQGKAIREYFHSEIAKRDENPNGAKDKEATLSKAIADLGSEPDRYAAHDGLAGDMDPVSSPEWKEWSGKKQALEEQHTASSTVGWSNYVQAMGGVKQATAAVQDAMRSGLNERFAQHYQKLTGRALKTGKTPVESSDKFLASTGAPEGAGERLSLGQSLEGQIRAAMPGHTQDFEGQGKAVGDMKGQNGMDGKYVGQQRAIKSIMQLKRTGLFLGPGSGKTPIMLGAAGELAKQGKRTIMAVPSIVQQQFGAEAIRFIDPASGIHVHARPGESFEERLAAYADPKKHAVVVTHQTLRDDTLKIVGQHLGHEGENATREWLMNTPKPEVAKTIKEAFGAKGIDFAACMVDEAHGALDRDGKEDSAFSRIIDAFSRNSTHMVTATGNPTKNDSSEAYSDLNHLDPDRYPDEGKAEFMRRYGADAATSRRSLAQQLTRYWFNGRVKLDKQAYHTHSKIELSGDSKAAIDQIELAAGKIRTGDDADMVKWAKVLAPKYFEGKPEEQHGDLAQAVKKAVGTFQEAAMNRVVNLDPTSPKIAAHVELAKKSVADGRPCVIFARNLEAVENIHKAMEAAGLKAVSLTGADSSKDKGDKIGTFQGGHADVIVMSDAGATGANLQRGKVLIHHDLPSTAMTYQQRNARIHRLGQKDDVEIHTMMADHPWERKAMERVKKKAQLGEIYESPEGYADDSGLAQTLREVRARRNQATPEAAA